MKLRRVLVAGAFVLGLAGCNRNRQDAILLANEADKSVKVDPEAAIQKYDEATKLDPQNHQVWNKLGQAYRAREKWPEMAEALGRAIKAEEAQHGKSTFANYYAQRGYALEMQAKKKAIAYEEAKEPYLSCIKIDPNYADCYHQLGNVYLWTDDEQNALKYYSQAIEHDPTQTKYYFPLAQLYLSLGYTKEADSVLKEAKSFANPSTTDVDAKRSLANIHVLAAQVAQDQNNTAEQVKELEAARAVAPADSPEAVTILYSLGSTYAALDPPKKQEAIEMLKGFSARACKSQKKINFAVQCETARTMVTSLGGTLQ